jgi:predicted GNAT family acetyltransferase
MADDVTDNAARNRYELQDEAGIAVAYYERRGNAIAITHTRVPEQLRGRGLAGILIKAAIADIRTRGLRLISECPFVTRYLQRHPEDRDLL